MSLGGGAPSVPNPGPTPEQIAAVQDKINQMFYTTEPIPGAAPVPTQVQVPVTPQTNAYPFGTPRARTPAQRRRQHLLQRQQQLHPQMTTKTVMQVPTEQVAVRQPQYDLMHNTADQLLSQQLDQQSQDAFRNMKFNLARRGQLGSSVQTDQNQKLMDAYQQGALDVSNKATDAANQLQTADEALRTRLLNEAQAGMGLNAAQAAAAAGFKTNLDNASTAASSENLGNVFANLAYAQQQGAFNQGYNMGYYGMPGQQFRPGANLGGGSSYSGTTSN